MKNKYLRKPIYNRRCVKADIKDCLLPLKLDSFNKSDDGFTAEYDGWEFEAKSEKALFNQILRYIFGGGEE
jgi:hypothetical protein